MSAAGFYYGDLWPADRIQAARGKALLAKRAAHSGFLWERYQENPKMTLKLLELWHDIEMLDKILAIPNWFRNQHQGPNLQEDWNTWAGPHLAVYRKQHLETMKEILKIS